MRVSMSPAKGYSREDILRFLQKSARDSGRPPKTHEPSLEKIVEAAKAEFGSWKHAMRIAGLETYKTWRKKRARALALLCENLVLRQRRARWGYISTSSATSFFVLLFLTGEFS